MALSICQIEGAAGANHQAIIVDPEGGTLVIEWAPRGRTDVNNIGALRPQDAWVTTSPVSTGSSQLADPTICPLSFSALTLTQQPKLERWKFVPPRHYQPKNPWSPDTSPAALIATGSASNDWLKTTKPGQQIVLVAMVERLSN